MSLFFRPVSLKSLHTQYGVAEKTNYWKPKYNALKRPRDVQMQVHTYTSVH